MTSPMSAEDNLAKLGLALPPAYKPVASYIPCVRVGNLLYVAGQIPLVDGKLPKTGRLGENVTVEEGQQLARTCVLNGLAAAKQELGDLSKIARVVRVGAFVASTNDFTQQPQVANGASELLVQVFGDSGKHARAAVGVNVLPLGAPVEVEFLFEIR